MTVNLTLDSEISLYRVYTKTAMNQNDPDQTAHKFLICPKQPMARSKTVHKINHATLYIIRLGL